MIWFNQIKSDWIEKFYKDNYPRLIKDFRSIKKFRYIFQASPELVSGLELKLL